MDNGLLILQEENQELEFDFEDLVRLDNRNFLLSAEREPSIIKRDEKGEPYVAGIYRDGGYLVEISSDGHYVKKHEVNKSIIPEFIEKEVPCKKPELEEEGQMLGGLTRLLGLIEKEPEVE